MRLERYSAGARMVAFALFLSYSAYVFAAWVVFGFGLDDVIPNSETLPIYVSSWVIVPLVALGLTLLVMWALPDDDVSRAHTALVGVNAAGWLLLTVGHYYLGGLTDVQGVTLPLLVGVVVANVFVILVRQVYRRGYTLAAGTMGLFMVGMVASSLFFPISVSDRYGEATVSFSTPNRLIAPCQTLSWQAEGIAGIYIGRIFDDKQGTTGNDSREFCIAEAWQIPIYELRVVFPDETERTYSLSLNSVFTRGWVIIGLTALAGVAVPPLVTATGRYEIAALTAFAGLLPMLDVGRVWFVVPGIIALLLAAASVRGYRPRWRATARPAIRRIADGLTLIIIPPLLINLAFPYDRLHANFWLGAINDLIHGKTLFVDASSQYGFLSQYALAGFFGTGVIPLSYEGLAFVSYALLALVTALNYLILRRLTGALIPAVLFVIGVYVMFISRGFYTISTHPGNGMLRYWVQYALIGVVVMRLSRKQRVWWVLEWTLLAVAFAWSFETWVFTWAPYLALTVYELVVVASGWRDGLIRFVWRGALLVSAAGVAFGLMVGFTWLRAGVLPDWSVYAGYLGTYSAFGWRFLVFLPWLPIISALYGTLAAALFALLTTRERSRLLDYVAPVGMACMGVMQMFYWVRLPVIGTLNAFSIPALFLGAYWLAQVERVNIPRRAVIGVRLVLLYGFWLLIISDIMRPPVQTQYVTPLDAVVRGVTSGEWDFNLSALRQPPLTYTEFRLPDNTDEQVSDLLAVLDEYTPNADEIALFAEPELSTDVLVRAGAVRPWRMSHPAMEDYSPVTSAWAAADDWLPTAGEIVIVQKGAVGGAQGIILERVVAAVSLAVIEETDSGFTVYQVSETKP